MEQPRLVAVAGQYGVDAHLPDGRLAELAQGRELTLLEDPFGQFLAARGAELLLVRNQFVAALALHLEAVAVQLAERVEELVERLDADAESHVVGIGVGKLAHGDTDHLVAVVDDRAAGVAGVHRRVGLDVVLPVHQLLGRRDGALGDGEGHAVGITRHADLVADRERIGGREVQLGECREVVIDGQQGDVQRRIHEHDPGQIGIAVVVVDGYRVEALDHVVVRDEEIPVLQVETASGASGVRYLEYYAIDILFHGASFLVVVEESAHHFCCSSPARRMYSAMSPRAIASVIFCCSS